MISSTSLVPTHASKDSVVIQYIDNANTLWIAVLGVVCVSVLCCLSCAIAALCRRMRREKDPSPEKIPCETPTAAHNEFEPEPGELRLVSWLADLGLLQYRELFVENGFPDGDALEVVLCELSDENLKEMGIAALAHRKLILNKIKRQHRARAKTDDGEKAEIMQMIDLGRVDGRATIGTVRADAESDSSSSDNVYGGISNGDFVVSPFSDGGNDFWKTTNMDNTGHGHGSV